MRKHYIYAFGQRYAISDSHLEVLKYLLSSMGEIEDEAVDTMNQLKYGSPEYNFCYGKAETVRQLWNDLVAVFDPEII